MKNNIEDKLKKVVKKTLGINTTINHSNCSEANFSGALSLFVKENKDIKNEKNLLPKRKDGSDFGTPIKEMEPNFNFFNVGVYEYGDDSVKEISEYDGLHSGTPMHTKPFPPCIKRIKSTLNLNNLYWYPSCVGNINARQDIVNYLVREGFKLEKQTGYDGLGIENIVFTCSTTHAYSLILKTIAHNEDVILLTGPNYGIFAIIPELTSAHVEILDLEEEDDFYVNPSKLSKKIDEINKDLIKKYKGKLDYQPRVVAFLNINPHNPLGKVMNKKNRNILESIGEVCLEKNVFVIDDLIYRDLTFDTDNLALPLATMPRYFNNTISLFGLSKAYGLASIRAAFVVAPYPIVRALANEIAHSMDSIPVLQVEAVAAGFNGKDSRYKALNSYIKPIIKEYQYRYNLLKALVEGIDKIKDEETKSKIYDDVFDFTASKEKTAVLLKGINGVTIRKKTEPDSGFFAVLDFTSLKGKKNDNLVINSDRDLLAYLYKKGKIRFIMGSNMCWPLKDEIIARVTFSLDKKALINNMAIINKSIGELK